MSRGLDERSKKFIDAVQADLRALSNETRRKFQPVKEVRGVFDAFKTVLCLLLKCRALKLNTRIMVKPLNINKLC